MGSSNKILAQSYEWDSFLNWSAWGDLERHLSSRGVCTGVGGARGSGKSWLLRHASDWAERNGGIGVYFPSPSAYDASAFLAGLCLALATKAEERLRPRNYTATAMLELMNKRSVQLASVVAAIGITAFLLRDAPIDKIITWSVAAAIIVYLYIALPAWWRKQRLDRNPAWKLYLKALAVQRWVQFSASSKSTSELAIEAGKGLIAKGRLSEELALSERPVTELALVTEFRDLAEKLAALPAWVVGQNGPDGSDEKMKVVVAIDELDKIGSVDDVRRLLRSVKGVLDPAGVILLVSVSDEAVTHLGLGGLRGRDEISSSFASMITVPAITQEEQRQLLRHLLGVAMDPVADALWVLTAGNQRESIRLLDRCIASSPVHALTPALCSDVATTGETNELLNSLVADAQIGEVQKIAVYELVDSWRRNGWPETATLLAFWNPTWGEDEGWPQSVSEEWQRYLVRQALRKEMKALWSGAGGAHVDQLVGAFEASQHSSSVARYLLEQGVAKPTLIGRTRPSRPRHAILRHARPLRGRLNRRIAGRKKAARQRALQTPLALLDEHLTGMI